MKRIAKLNVMALLIVLLLNLSSCTSYGPVYSNYKSIEIDGELIYLKELPYRTCDYVSYVSLFAIVEDKEYAIEESFSDCSNELYVKSNNEYIKINQAISKDIISGESVLAYEWPFEYYEAFDFFGSIEIDYIIIEDKDHYKTIKIDDRDSIEDIQDNSVKIYHKFLIGYPISDEIDGYITIFDFNGNSFELEIMDYGIYYRAVDSFQVYSKTRGLQDLFYEHFDIIYK